MCLYLPRGATWPDRVTHSVTSCPEKAFLRKRRATGEPPGKFRFDVMPPAGGASEAYDQ